MKKTYIRPMISAQTIETINVLCASGDSLPAGAIQLTPGKMATTSAY